MREPPLVQLGRSRARSAVESPRFSMSVYTQRSGLAQWFDPKGCSDRN